MRNTNKLYLEQICNELKKYPAVDRVDYYILYPEDIMIEICLSKGVFKDPMPIIYTDIESLNKELNINLITSLIMDFVSEIAVKSGYCEDYDDFDEKINTYAYNPIIGESSRPPLNTINNNFIQEDVKYNLRENTYEITFYNPYTGEQKITKLNIGTKTWHDWIGDNNPTDEYFCTTALREANINQATNFSDYLANINISTDDYNPYIDNYNPQQHHYYYLKEKSIKRKGN